MALPFYWIPAVNYAEVSGKVTGGSDVDVGFSGVKVSTQTYDADNKKVWLYIKHKLRLLS